MFTNIREKLQNVQENITISFRGFSTNDPSDQRKTLHRFPLNYNAGTDVLERFQRNWAEINGQTVANAKTAEAADKLICQLHKHLEHEWQTASQASAVLSKIPQVIHEVELLSEKLGEVGGLISAVEESLIRLENIIETGNLQHRQLEHRFQLALYKEHKLSQLENTRVVLAREHTAKVALHEARQQRVKQERQEAFEQQFKQDLTTFKETHHIPKVSARSIGFKETKLEEVVLEADDPSILSEFLHESSAEPDEQPVTDP